MKRTQRHGVFVCAVLLLCARNAYAPPVTGVWETLYQADFLDVNQFQTQYRADGTPITVINPFTKIDTGKSARQLIQEQAATFGWPLVGLYISGSGSSPHFVIHRSQFPPQTGSQAQRAERLQTALQTALDNVYKSTVQIIDPTDPDFGQTVDLRNFWAAVRVWNYRADGLYVPRLSGVGDYAMRVSDISPPGNWWIERN